MSWCFIFVVVVVYNPSFVLCALWISPMGVVKSKSEAKKEKDKKRQGETYRAAVCCHAIAMPSHLTQKGKRGAKKKECAYVIIHHSPLSEMIRSRERIVTPSRNGSEGFCPSYLV